MLIQEKDDESDKRLHKAAQLTNQIHIDISKINQFALCRNFISGSIGLETLSAKLFQSGEKP